MLHILTIVRGNTRNFDKTHGTGTNADGNTYPHATPWCVCQQNTYTLYPSQQRTARGTKGGPSPTDWRTQGDHIPGTTTPMSVNGTTNYFGQQFNCTLHPTNQTTNPSTKNKGKYSRRATSNSSLSTYPTDISPSPISAHCKTNLNREEESTANETIYGWQDAPAINTTPHPTTNVPPKIV